MPLEEVISWMLMLLMCVTIAHSTAVTYKVDKNSCGKQVNIDFTESVRLYLPSGEIEALDDCRFEFTSATFEHDTCFKLTTNLDCNVEIEYRHFSSLVERKIQCGDPDALQEHCEIYTSMTVLFKVRNSFHSYYETEVEVYRKYDKEDNESSSFSFSTLIPIFVVVIVVGIVCSIMKRICINARNSSSEPMAASSLPLETSTTRPSAPDTRHTSNTTPQSYGYRYQPEGDHTGGNEHGYHSPLQNYPQGYQPATEPNNTSAPPPSYEEAQYYPAPSKSTTYPNDGDDEQFGPGAGPGSKVPDVPPPPYPGL